MILRVFVPFWFCRVCEWTCFVFLFLNNSIKHHLYNGCKSPVLAFHTCCLLRKGFFISWWLLFGFVLRKLFLLHSYNIRNFKLTLNISYNANITCQTNLIFYRGRVIGWLNGFQTHTHLIHIFIQLYLHKIELVCDG